MAINRNVKGNDLIDKRRKQNSLSGNMGNSKGYLYDLNPIYSECAALFGAAARSENKKNIFDLSSEKSHKSQSQTNNSYETERRREEERRRENYTAVGGSPYVDSPYTDYDSIKYDQPSYEQEYTEQTHTEQAYTEQSSYEDKKHEEQSYNNPSDEYTKVIEQEKAAERKREEEHKREEEFRRIREADTPYRAVGTGMGMKDAEKSSIFNGHKELYTQIMNFDISAKFIEKSVQNEQARMLKEDEARRSAIDAETERKREERKQRMIETDKAIRSHSAREMVNATSALTVGTAALNRSAIHGGKGPDSYMSDANFKSKMTSSVIRDSAKFDTETRKTTGYQTGAEQAVQFETNYRLLHTASANAGKSVMTGIYGRFKAADFMDSEYDEFADAKHGASQVTKRVGGAAFALSRLTLARSMITGGQMAEFDRILNGGKSHEFENMYINARSKEDFRKANEAIGKKISEKYGRDISKMNSKGLDKFASIDAEHRKLVETFRKARRAEDISGAPLRVKNIAKGTLKAAVAAVVVTRGDAFVGIKQFGHSLPVKAYTAAKSSVWIGKALRKQQITFNKGYSLAKQGLGKVTEFRKITGRPFEPLSAKAGRATYNINKKVGKAVDKATVGKTRQVRNFIRSKKNALAQSFSRGRLRSVIGRRAGKQAAKTATSTIGTGALRTGGGGLLRKGIFGALNKSWARIAATKIGAKIAASAIGKSITVALSAAAGAASFGISLIIEAVIMIIIIIVCISCSCGVNDLFSNGTVFTVNNEGVPVSDPNKSVAAETMYMLDTYLSRNYEFICKRGMEEAVLKSMEGTDPDVPSMSQTKAFTIDFSGGLSNGALVAGGGAGGVGETFELTDSEYEGMPESTKQGAETVKAWEKSQDKYASKSEAKILNFDAGRVCVLQHKNEEVILKNGMDASLSGRYVIKQINGTKTQFTLETEDGVEIGVKISEAQAKKLFEANHPLLIERYVYDVESHNSIWITDYDHTVLPDLKNVMAMENEKDYLTYEKRAKFINLDTTDGNEFKITEGTGEYTPFDNAPLENTKEIMAMAVAAFSNEFITNTGITVASQGVTPDQFQAYCYAMWLKSHYITTEQMESAKGNYNWWNKLLSFFTSTEWDMKEQLEKDVQTASLTSIRPFGEIKKNDVTVKATAKKSNAKDPGVNIIAPINTLSYAPEAFHYGVYALNNKGILGVDTNTDPDGNNKPYMVASNKVNKTLNSITQTNMAKFKATGDEAYYDGSNPVNAGLIVAAKLPILNLETMSKSGNWFESKDENIDEKKFKLTKYDTDSDNADDSVGKNQIYYTRTKNYRYFENKSTLIAKKIDETSMQNQKSFIFNDNYWIGVPKDDDDWTKVCGSEEPKKYYWKNVNLLGELSDVYLKKNRNHSIVNETFFYDGSEHDTMYMLREILSDSPKKIDGQNFSDMSKEKGELLRDEEDMLQKKFYNLFATNTGYDKPGTDAANTYKFGEYTNADGGKEKLSYDKVLMTDCGTQQAYAGSVFLSKAKPDKYKTRGRRDVIMNVLNQTNSTKQSFANDSKKSSKQVTANDYYWKGEGNDPDKADLPTGIYLLGDVLGTGDSYVQVDDGVEVPCYVVTCDFCATDDDGSLDVEKLQKMLKKYINPYMRAMIVYVCYDQEYEDDHEDQMGIQNVECDEDDCIYIEEDEDGDEHGECECDEDYEGGSDEKNSCEEKYGDEEYYPVGFKFAAMEQIPQAEFCGFYLCGGHTQVALMPVILTMTGSENLFTVEMDDSMLNGLGLSSRTFIGQNFTDLEKIWDTTSAAARTADDGRYTVAKQNKINAFEALSDNWESKYRLDYSRLRDQSNTLARDLRTRGNEYYNPSLSYLKHNDIINTSAFGLGKAANNNVLAQKYKLNGSSLDCYAQVMQEGDLETILDMVELELIAKGVNPNTPVTAPEINNQYENRVTRIVRALSKVGKIGYSQANHQWPYNFRPAYAYNELVYKTDCSGFVSWACGLGMAQYLSPAGAWVAPPKPSNEIKTSSLFTAGVSGALTREGTARNWWPVGSGLSQAKPGDILAKNGHVMMYVCKDPTNADRYFIVECTSKGGKLGPGGVQFVGKTTAYLSKYKVIRVDMDVFPSLDRGLKLEK